MATSFVYFDWAATWCWLSCIWVQLEADLRF
jgi:hypothetical protein